jgi:hypothetical protein
MTIGHEYFIDIKMADRIFHTYGEFIITLIGTNGKSEPLKFERLVKPSKTFLIDPH